MQLTPEQRADIERQRSDEPERRRFLLALTPEQREEYRRAVAEEMASRPENIRRSRALLAALREPTFSGWLRRMIAKSAVPHDELARRIGLDVERINGFLCGHETLSSDVIDQLAAELGLTPDIEAIEQE